MNLLLFLLTGTGYSDQNDSFNKIASCSLHSITVTNWIFLMGVSNCETLEVDVVNQVVFDILPPLPHQLTLSCDFKQLSLCSMEIIIILTCFIWERYFASTESGSLFRTTNLQKSKSLSIPSLWLKWDLVSLPGRVTSSCQQQRWL